MNNEVKKLKAELAGKNEIIKQLEQNIIVKGENILCLEDRWAEAKAEVLDLKGKNSILEQELVAAKHIIGELLSKLPEHMDLSELNSYIEEIKDSKYRSKQMKKVKDSFERFNEACAGLELECALNSDVVIVNTRKPSEDKVIVDTKVYPKGIKAVK